MHNIYFSSLLEETPNIVFIGEAGSGKTELALNLALTLSDSCEKTIHFFDMDQTKPVLRARNTDSEMSAAGVVMHYQDAILDAPVVAPAVVETLLDKNAITLIDVGGGSRGSHMIGQFSHVLNRDFCRILYIFNPYRPWSGNIENISQTMSRTIGAARLREISIVANPNLGPDTTLDDVLSGIERVKELFPDSEILFTAALSHLAAEVQERTALPVLSVDIKTLPDWF